MNQYVIEFDNPGQNLQEVTKSPSPSHVEKIVSDGLSEAFDKKYGERIQRVGYQKVNFDVQIKNQTIYVKKSFWVRDNGEVEVFKEKHKYPMGKHSISKSLIKKVENLAMSIHIPIPLLLFRDELTSTFKEGLAFKFIGTSLITSLFAFMGITPEQLLMGTGLFILIAMFDALLGIMPNTKNGTDVKKEHTIQSKFWKLVVNLVAMAGLISIHLFTKNLIPDPNWLQYIPLNIHYLGIGYLLLNYGYSIFKYIAVANNSKVPIPGVITKQFKKEE